MCSPYPAKSLICIKDYSCICACTNRKSQPKKQLLGSLHVSYSRIGRTILKYIYTMRYTLKLSLIQFQMVLKSQN